MWPFRKATKPADLAGQWRVEPDDPRLAEFGDHAMTFTADGELIYSSIAEGMTTSRILLTYRLDGGTIVTNQPSAPREERTKFELGEHVLRVGDPALTLRRDANFRSDPLAPAVALGLAALERTLGSSAPEGPFRPFMLFDTVAGRKTVDIVGDHTQQARASARHEFERMRESVVAMAWVSDTGDAVAVEASCRHAPRGVLLIQPYRSSGRRASRAAKLESHDHDSWFSAEA
jgi:hypothetical protein